MTDPEDRAFAIDLWVDSQADLLRPTGCEDPDAVARALWLSDLQVVPLADPAPVGLSQEDRELVEEIRNGTYGRPVGHVEALLAIIDRLSPSTEENVCGSCGKNHSEDPLCTN